MPPKKKGQEKVSKKAEEKRQEKIIEDKTFGLKNKKSASVQKYIKGVAQKVKGQERGGTQYQIDEAHRQKEEKKKEQANQALLASLFKTVVTIKEVDGQDPKSIVCPYFKQGVCTKGDKCKFSHNLNPHLEKPDLYTDSRESKTDITCKFFLEAVISRKHGWFWKCPNGDDCIYRHCLPEGYVIPDPDDSVIAELEEEDEIPLEDQLEEERQKLPSGGTPVTRESFYAWLERKNMRKTAKEEEEKKAGLRPSLNFRERFTQDPSAFVDDDSAMDEYKRDEDNQASDEEEKQPVDDTPEDSETSQTGHTYIISEDTEETKEEVKEGDVPGQSPTEEDPSSEPVEEEEVPPPEAPSEAAVLEPPEDPEVN